MSSFAKRELGQSGLKVSAIGLGCMGMSFGYSGAEEKRSIKTIHRALDLGVTFLDTADIYGPETNERLLAKSIAGRRGEVQLATKFGIAYDKPDGVQEGERLIDGRPEYIAQACDRSLQRLGVEHIDLYYMHRMDPSVPIEDSIGAMARLVEAGKVRHIGLSEAAIRTIRRAHATHPLTAVQTEYSLWSRDVEDEILPTLRELGIGLVPYSPLGRGFLSGKITSQDDLEEGDWRRGNPRFEKGNLEKNLALVARLEEIAKDKGITAAQLALAWVLHQGADIVPIPGTTRPQRLEENAAAINVELSDGEVQRLEEVFAPGAAAGQRYPEPMMKLVGR